jgi:hypothetical protein
LDQKRFWREGGCKRVDELERFAGKAKGPHSPQARPFCYFPKTCRGNVFEKQSDKPESYSSRLFFSVNAFNGCMSKALLTMLISIYESLKTFITGACQKYFISLLEEIVEKLDSVGQRSILVNA